MLLSPLGERLGEGVIREEIFELTPSPSLSPKEERNMRVGERNMRKGAVSAVISPIA